MTNPSRSIITGTPVDTDVNDVIDIWMIRNHNNDDDLGDVDRLSLLSPDEQDRAARYRVSTKRTQYIASRIAIRSILSTYLDCLPAEVGLSATPAGRPQVVDSQGAELLSISVSHSANLCAMVVGRAGRSLGLDMEFPGDDGNLAPVTSVCLSPHEREWFTDLPQFKQAETLRELWTLKEALLKAAGWGMSQPLSEISTDRSEDQIVLQSVPKDLERATIRYAVNPSPKVVSRPQFPESCPEAAGDYVFSVVDLIPSQTTTQVAFRSVAGDPSAVSAIAARLQPCGMDVAVGRLSPAASGFSSFTPS